jgi:hypothetical protein
MIQIFNTNTNTSSQQAEVGTILEPGIEREKPTYTKTPKISIKIEDRHGNHTELSAKYTSK